MDRWLTMMALVLLCLAGCGEVDDPTPTALEEIDLFSPEGQAILDAAPALFTVHAIGVDGARVRLATGITSESLADLAEAVATEETTLQVKPLSMDELDIVFGMRGRGAAAYSNQYAARSFREQPTGSSSGGAGCGGTAGWER